MTGTDTRQSARDRLEHMPAVFSGVEFAIAQGMSPSVATVMLGRWRDARHISTLGGNIWVNHFAGASLETHRDEVVARLHRSGVYVGASVVFNEGLTTQRPREIQIVVLRGSPNGRSTFPRYELIEKSQSWFISRGQGIDRNQAMARLNPAWALADMLYNRQPIAPDDLDLDDADHLHVHLIAAVAALFKSHTLARRVQDAETMKAAYEAAFDATQKNLLRMG